MKRTAAVSVFLALAMMLCLSIATANEAEFLGEPFPDFSVTDTEGNSFTLSEQLKDHEAVLINFWATWCNPCRTEFSYLREVWEKYGDRVAFIALSPYATDTLEKVTAYREANGISFPMGLDAGGELYKKTGSGYYPTTVIVDRFGHAVFFLPGTFFNPAEIERVLECFTGEDYTESAVLKEVPADRTTRVYPVSAKRSVVPENENVKTIIIHVEDAEEPYTCYVVPEEKAHLRLEIASTDHPETMGFVDSLGSPLLVSDTLDSERNAYVYDQSTEGPQGDVYYHFNAGMLTSLELGTQDPDRIRFLLIRDEAYMDEVIETLRQAGYSGDISWEYADSAQTDSNPTETDQTYTINVMDQDHQPVPGVCVNFCTESACAMVESDENGVIFFDGAPDVYHVQIIVVPEGYSFDEDFELYTDRTGGAWVLYIRKD